MVFHLIAEKKGKFLDLIHETLSCRVVSVKTLQRLAGKCVSFSLVVPGALLFTREKHCAISEVMRTNKPVRLYKALQEEITHWLFLENWDDPLPWRDERHLGISLATDASGSGWGGKLLSPPTASVADYWTETEQGYDINTREAIALNKVLLSFADVLKNARVDAEIDNKALYFSWCNQGGRSVALNRAVKELFFTTVKLNIVLQLSFIPTNENPADAPSRRLSTLGSMLSPRLWGRVQSEFGGPGGHTCDLMALDSNVMKGFDGRSLPHFTPRPSPESSGVNVLAQNLSGEVAFLDSPYVFSPLALVGPVLRHLERHHRSCTMVVLDLYPRKCWWPLIQKYSTKSCRLARRGDHNALLKPSAAGWIPHPGFPGDLWAYALNFH